MQAVGTDPTAPGGLRSYRCGVLPSLCMHRSGSVTLMRELPALFEATAENFTRSPMWNPCRTLNDAEYQASRALWPCARLQTPLTHTVTRLPAFGPAVEYTNTLNWWVTTALPK